MSFTSFASKAVLAVGAVGLLASGGAAAASAAPVAAPKATARTAIYNGEGEALEIVGGWDAISGRFPGGLSPAQRGAYVTTSVTAGASAGRQTPVAPELAPAGRLRIVWGVRPAGRFTIFTGPGVYLLGTRWASWTAATARATGELWGVDAKRADLGHASIVLSAPESHDGLVYYSALHIVGVMGVVPYWRWNWSGGEIGWTPAG